MAKKDEEQPGETPADGTPQKLTPPPAATVAVKGKNREGKAPPVPKQKPPNAQPPPEPTPGVPAANSDRVETAEGSTWTFFG